MFDFLNEENLGKDYKGFILLSIDDLPDYKAKALYLRHKKTGLEVYHILADDKENTFAFAFRTVAKDSKGCAHIMEHSTLCGSEKYPLKEPFTTLAGQSLNTFLNAMTYPDKTVYPGSSVVKADYFTMLDVYADAVFFPKLDYETFIQEGHRLEMDENGKLSIQGVVYNEMKGNYSAFIDIAVDEQIKAMYPDSFPAFDSGGDPLVIPTLTYQEFLDFHQKFYNPDNCLLYLYGNIPTAEQLDYLDEHFIDRLEKKYDCRGEIENAYCKTPLVKEEIKELQKLNLLEESTEIKAYAPETGATGSIVAMNWYSGKSDMEKYYLSEVLCGNDSSPLSKRLKDSKLGDDFCPIWNNFGQMQQEFFCYGLSGVKKGDEEKVFKLVQKSLQEIYDEGISEEDINSAVMGIDFSLREVTRYWGPYSLVIMEKVLKGWNYGNPCCQQLSPITSFEKVKEKIKSDKEYTKNLIRKYFLDNKVVVKLIIEPSDKYFEERNKVENELIARLEKNLDKNQLKKDLELLHQTQQHIETAEEIACIPHTKISELDTNIDLVKTDLSFIKGSDGSKLPLFINREQTNGIFYMDVMFPFDGLEPKYYRHIPTLSNVITNMGWNGKSWDDCISESACVMGDVWGRTYCSALPDSPECQDFAEKYKEGNFIGRQWIGLTCKALTENAEKTLNLLSEIISKMSFDDDQRFESLLQEIKADRKSSLVQNGRDFAIKRARAVLSKNLALNEIMWGISQYKTVESYKKKDIPQLLKTFKELYYACISQGAVLHVTADEESIKKILPLLEDFAKKTGLTSLKAKKDYTLDDYLSQIYKVQNIKGIESFEAIKVDSQTGYAAVISPGSEYLSKEASAENIFSAWLNTHTLWDKIRTTGGAYGANAWNDSIEKYFGMCTYRDPTPLQSIKVYLETLKELSEYDFEAHEIERTIVSIYGNAICPAAPKDRGEKGFWGMLYANHQEFRLKPVDNLLGIKPEDVKNAALRIYNQTQKMCKKAVFCDKSVSTDDLHPDGSITL